MTKEEIAATLGQNILRQRKAAGMTQAQLAEAVNVGTAFISHVERGEKLVSIPVLCAMAELFRISYDELLRGEEYNTGIKNIQVALSGRSEAYIKVVEQMIHTLDQLPAE